MKMEEWRDIAGYEGCYQASSYGRIKSLERLVKRAVYGNWTIKERILKYQKGNHCAQVNLSRLGISKTIKVHTLIADTFIPNPYNLPEVNHLDNDPMNNHVTNLERCTHKQNMEHCAKQLRNTIGEKSHFSKITAQDVRLIRDLWTTQKVKRSELANRFGVTGENISKIVHREIWKHID